MFDKNLTLNDVDSEIPKVIDAEEARQEAHIELIASENYTSPAVMTAQGSQLTNKYAEGYPSKRYYGGCEYVDMAEDLAISRAKELFGAAYANVQPHSGSTANAAVFQALLVPGDTILGMSLAHGGHLTHGAAPSFSGKNFNAVQYGLDESTGEIDYNQVEELAKEHMPKMIIAGFSAYSRVIDWQRFRDIADMVGAYLLVDMAHVAGLIATGDYPSPINIADVCTTTTHKTLRGPRGGLILAKANEEIQKKLDSAIFPGIQGGPLMHIIAAKAVAFGEALQPEFKQYIQQVKKNASVLGEVLMSNGIDIVTGGTDSHMVLVDLRSKNVTGKDAEESLERAGMTCNKNGVANDPNPPTITSGIRLGSPAATTRGFKEDEFRFIGEKISTIINTLSSSNSDISMIESSIKKEVEVLCSKYPIYNH